MDPERIPEEEFDIEDIIREFSDPDPELGDILRVFAPQTPKEKAPVVSGDTIRVELPAKAKPPAQRQDTAVFTPIAQPPAWEEEEEIPGEMPPLKAPEPEPFSDDWEPEYEEPIADYEPRAPIQFPQKNRQRLLRQKLVAGPEKRFHQLTAAGVTGLQAGMVIHFLLVVFTAVSTIAVHTGSVPAAWQQPLLFGQLVAILLAGLVGCYRLLSGLGNLLRGRFHLNTLLLASFLACAVDAFFCLRTRQMPLGALFCLEMLMAQCAAWQERVTEIGQMDTLRRANDLTAMVKISQYWDERPGYAAVDGEPEQFLRHYTQPSVPDTMLRRGGLVTLAVGVAVAVWIGYSQTLAAAVRTFAACLLLGMPATAFISMSRPASILQKRLQKLGAVLCGWQGISQAERLAVYPLSSEDLFPGDVIRMGGTKFYGDEDPGKVVAYTAALAAANGSGLHGALENLPRGRDGLNQYVEGLTAYDGGLYGLVNGTQVLVGTAAFMESVDMEIPQRARIADALYTFIDGQLSGVFAVSYGCSQSSAAGLRYLCGWNSVTPVLVSQDFMLTPPFIRQKLRIRPRSVVFPERALRQTLSEIQPDRDAPVIALVTKPGLASRVYALNSAHALRSALQAGAWIHMIAGILGLVIGVVLPLLGATQMLSAANLLLYVAIWMIPGWLATEWTRFV